MKPRGILLREMGNEVWKKMMPTITGGLNEHCCSWVVYASLLNKVKRLFSHAASVTAFNTQDRDQATMGLDLVGLVWRVFTIQ